jgi:hypothetical protein
MVDRARATGTMEPSGHVLNRFREQGRAPTESDPPTPEE